MFFHAGQEAAAKEENPKGKGKAKVKPKAKEKKNQAGVAISAEGNLWQDSELYDEWPSNP